LEKDMSENNQSKTVSLYYQPYDKQIEVHQCESKYRFIAAGRRAGKTKLAVGEILKLIMDHYGDEHKLQIAWIAPTYAMAGRGIDTLKEIARDLLSDKILEVKGVSPQIATINSHKIYFLSVDRPDSLRGYYFDFIVLDEAAYIPDKAFHDVILPTLLDNDAPLLAISTPAGEYGFFHSFAMKSSGDDTVSFFKFTTYDNPYISKEVLDEMKSQLPESGFKQEIMAEFVSMSDALIHNFEQLNDKSVCKCDSQKIVGLDLAKMHDWTVALSCCPECGLITDILRMQKIDWPEQKQKIMAFYEQNNGFKMIFDANSIGDVMGSAFEGEGVNLIPFKITAPSKKEMVNSMVLALEQAKIRWDFDVFPIIESELRTFRPELNKNGYVSYNAAPGCHDDVVTSLALIATEILKGSHRPFLYDLETLVDKQNEPKEEVSPLVQWMNEEDD
jgi:hypothetical protein